MLGVVLPPLARSLSGLAPGSDLDFFRRVRYFVQPEPAEHVGYVVLVLCALAAVCVLVPLAGRAMRGLSTDQLRAVALVAQAVVVVVVAHAWWPAFKDGGWRIDVALVCAGLTVVVAGSERVRSRLSALRLGDSLLWLVPTLVLTALMLKTAVFTDGTIWAADPATRFHIPFTFEELTAVGGGRTPGVDFYPQYVALFGYVAAPILGLFDNSLLAFTGLMTLCTAVALFAAFHGLRLLTGSRGWAFVLFIPLIGLALFPGAVSGAQSATAANYYASFPLRYLGPFVLFALVARVAKRPTRAGTVVAGAVAALVAFNNLDFGLVASGAALVGLVLACDDWAAIRTTVVRAVLGGLAAVVVVVLFILIRSGSLPDPNILTFFIGTFGSAGFFMLPLHHPLGLSIPLFITYVAALAVAAALFRARSDRVERALLAYAGVLGLGTLSYWVGRSHPLVLLSLYAFWGLALVLLAFSIGRRVALAPQPLLIAPAALVVFHLALGVTAIWLQPLREKPAALVEDGPESLAAPAMTDYVKRCAPPDRNVVIAYPTGYRIAAAAGVTNWMPYNDVRTIVTRQELDELLRAIDKHHVRKVFLSPDAKLTDPLLHSGLPLVFGKRVAADSNPEGTRWVGMRIKPGTPIPAGCVTKSR